MPRKKRVNAGAEKGAIAKRRAIFIEAYLQNGENATQAAIKAGYSKRTARQQGSRLLSNVDVRATLDARRAKVVQKAMETTELTAEEVVRSLARDLRFDPLRAFQKGKLIEFEKMDEDTRLALRGMSYDAQGRPVLKFPEKTAVREQGMKYFGLYKEDNAQRGDPAIKALLDAIAAKDTGFSVKP